MDREWVLEVSPASPEGAGPRGEDRSDRSLPLSQAERGRTAAPARHDALSPFAGLEGAPAILLAVSGGPDSMALMLLAHGWRAGLVPPGPSLHVATVDHGLRLGSRQEAEDVAMAARALGLSHTTLPWVGRKPSRRIQERARGRRYALLATHAAAIGATHLLTAHHADDQAETILFRLGRGSGLGGLAGMRRVSMLPSGLWLVRPLLDRTKADLVAVCQAAGQRFIDDPSNSDPAYARGRLRALAPAAAELGLDTTALLRLGARMARAEAALAAEAARQFDLIEAKSEGGRFEAKLAALRDAMPEIMIRVLRKAIQHVAIQPVGGPEFLPRLDRLEGLAERISEALRAGRAVRSTLGGTCVILRRDTMLVVVPEPPRRRGRLSAETT